MTGSLSGGATNDDFDVDTHNAMPEDFVTRLFLMRHGEVEGMGTREVRGQRDVALSDLGRAQHHALAEWFRDRESGLTRVISSPLIRCRKLGEIVAQAAGLPLELEAALSEQHMGIWQGRTWGAISRDGGGAINDYWDDYWNAAPPGGESMASMAVRVLGWWRSNEAELRGGRIVLVTHAGVIRALLTDFLGLPGDQSLRFAPMPATLTSIAHSGGGFVLEGLGQSGSTKVSIAPQAVNEALPASASNQAFGVAKPARAASVKVSPPIQVQPLRVALSGSAGTGKTTLGRALALALDVPFIEEGMRVRLEAGLDLGALDYDALEALNQELWEEHRELERRHCRGFVCDRSSLDFAAFRLHYGFFKDEPRMSGFFQETIKHAQTYSHVLVFPHGVLPLEADGVRLPNPWFQLRFQLCVEGLIKRHIESTRRLAVPSTDDFDKRLAWVSGRVRGNPVV